MPIDIYPPSPRLLSKIDSRFGLQRDGWNDFGFGTLYHLYFRPGDSADDVTYMGGVKILKLGQTAGDSQLIREPFSKLSRKYVSVGTSLDYYQRLNEIPPKYRSQIMRAINDAVAFPELVDQFKSEPGWEISVFRDNSDWNRFIADARALYEGNFASLAGIEQVFSYFPPRSKKAIEFNFSAPEPEGFVGARRRVGPSQTRTLLPDRVIVLVGRNGSGKSTLLSRIARIAFASPQERASQSIKSLGKIEPKAIGFMRVITISYSAFDSFIVPGVAAKDLSQLVDDIQAGDGRFVFCGLRDIVAEVRDDVDKAEAEVEDDDDAEILVERRTSTKLKPVDALADEFSGLLTSIRKNDQRALFVDAVKILASDPSFADLDEQIEEMLATPGRARKIFLGWSTGHKIALHVVASLVANARPRSLVLFDEPEAHLHPPLMATLMHAVRMVLTEVDACCIVATHSPVIVQETLAQHVRYVSRVGSKVSVTTPNLETFGENIGVLTYDSFGLTASSTDYHVILDLLVAGFDDIGEIDDVFTPGLSGQARAYVAAKLAQKDSEQ